MPQASLAAAAADSAGMWHGQHGQDYIIAGLFEHKKVGFFVDLAANDPVVLSNSRALERDYGWRGVCIEPQEALTKLLSAGRQCTVVKAVVSREEAGEVTFREKAGAMPTWTRGVRLQKHTLSNVVSNGSKAERGSVDRRVRTQSLAALLSACDAPRTIEYLSLGGPIIPSHHSSSLFRLLIPVLYHCVLPLHSVCVIVRRRGPRG